jgi:putative DNA primase/helicase
MVRGGGLAFSCAIVFISTYNKTSTFRHHGGILYQELNSFIQTHGFSFKAEELTLDGEIHSYKTEEFKGWYVGSTEKTTKGQTYATLTLCDYRKGKWFVRTDTGEVSEKELSAIKARDRQKEKARQGALLEIQKDIAKRALEKFKEFESTPTISRYQEDKRLVELEVNALRGVKVIRDGSIIIAMKDVEGVFWGYQKIDGAGQKLFVDGQRFAGCFYRFGNLDKDGVIYLCEGFATGASIYGASGKTTVACFAASNLGAVARAFRKHYRDLRIVICGDEDIWKLNGRGRPNHTGRISAKKAATEVHGSTCQVSFRDLAPELTQERRPTDFNDLHVLCGIARVREQLEAHYATAPHEYIATENQGFHDLIELKNGSIRWEPNYTDLRDYFKRSNPYVVMNESESIYVYRRGVYKQAVGLDLGQYAQDSFRIGEQEACNNKLAKEFEGAVKRTNVRPVQWFSESVEGCTNFINGYLEIETGKFNPHTPDRAFRTQLPYEYDPNAKCPNFDQFLSDVTCGREDLGNMLLEFLGYTLSNDKPWLQTALLLIGGGSNGKSTFLDVLKELIGLDNMTAHSVNDLGQGYNAQSLDGKMANLSFESDKKAFYASDLFKGLVTGDPLSVRAPYEKPYTMEPRAKYLIAFNSMPQSNDESDGFWRRMLPAPFDAKFSHDLGNVDTQIHEKLMSELSGVYNRCITAYMGTKARGFITIPEVSRELVGSIRKDNDPVAQFIEEAGLRVWDGVPINGATPPPWGEKDGDAPCIKAGEIYSEYVNWSDKNGFKAFNSVHFSRRALAVLRRDNSNGTVTSKTLSRGGKKLKAWVGVDWRGVLEM